MATTPHKRTDAPAPRHGRHMAGGAASASDSANAPRTSRHAAPAQSTPQTPARARFPRSSPVSPGDTMSVPVHPSGPDATSAFVPLEADAPRPIGRLSSGQGARLTTRDNAMEAREAATISREYSGDRRMSQSRRPKVASARIQRRPPHEPVAPAQGRLASDQDHGQPQGFYRHRHRRGRRGRRWVLPAPRPFVVCRR